MRQIKFRVWDKHLKLMREVTSIDLKYKEVFYLIDNEITYISRCFSEVEIMQSTGLHDKNGVEIYEGDILELVNDAGRRVLAICKLGNRRLTTENGDMIDIQCFYFEIEGRKTNPIACNYKGVHDLEIMEVIGNIHENPEILEVGDDH